MAFGMRFGDGRDFEQVFTNRTLPTLFSPVSIRDSAGTDVINRFENMRSGSYASSTGFRTAGGTDINQLLDTSAGTAITFSDSVTSGDVPAGEAPAYGTAYIQMLSNGLLNLLGSWATSVSRAWYSNPAANVGSAWYVYFQTGTLPSATSASTNANQWLPISGQPLFAISRTSPNSGTSSVSANLLFSRASAVGTVVATCPIAMTAKGLFKNV